MSSVEARLSELGIEIPEPATPGANYIPFVIVGDLVFVSGQVSLEGSVRHTGRLGEDLELEAGVEAAKVCALNLLSHVRTACDGDLDRLVRVVKLTGFVNSSPDFDNHPAVINGASDFLVKLLGEKGRHSRSAIGVAALPFGFAVEIEGIFQIRTS